MERWILVVGVVGIFLSLAVVGWHYQRDDNAAQMCANAEAHCGEERP